MNAAKLLRDIEQQKGFSKCVMVRFVFTFMVHIAVLVVMSFSDWYDKRRRKRAGGFHIHVWGKRHLEMLQPRSGVSLLPRNSFVMHMSLPAGIGFLCCFHFACCDPWPAELECRMGRVGPRKAPFVQNTGADIAQDSICGCMEGGMPSALASLQQHSVLLFGSFISIQRPFSCISSRQSAAVTSCMK